MPNLVVESTDVISETTFQTELIGSKVHHSDTPKMVYKYVFLLIAFFQLDKYQIQHKMKLKCLCENMFWILQQPRGPGLVGGNMLQL